LSALFSKLKARTHQSNDNERASLTTISAPRPQTLATSDIEANDGKEEESKKLLQHLEHPYPWKKKDCLMTIGAITLLVMCVEVAVLVAPKDERIATSLPTSQPFFSSTISPTAYPTRSPQIEINVTWVLLWITTHYIWIFLGFYAIYILNLDKRLQKKKGISSNMRWTLRSSVVGCFFLILSSLVGSVRLGISNAMMEPWYDNINTINLIFTLFGAGFLGYTGLTYTLQTFVAVGLADHGIVSTRKRDSIGEYMGFCMSCLVLMIIPIIIFEVSVVPYIAAAIFFCIAIMFSKLSHTFYKLSDVDDQHTTSTKHKEERCKSFHRVTLKLAIGWIFIGVLFILIAAVDPRLEKYSALASNLTVFGMLFVILQDIASIINFSLDSFDKSLTSRLLAAESIRATASNPQASTCKKTYVSINTTNENGDVETIGTVPPAYDNITAINKNGDIEIISTAPPAISLDCLPTKGEGQKHDDPQNWSITSENGEIESIGTLTPAYVNITASNDNGDIETIDMAPPDYVNITDNNRRIIGTAPPATRPPWLSTNKGLGQKYVLPQNWSISLENWLRVVRACMNTETWRCLAVTKGEKNINMYDVNEHFVKPWTRGTGCSIAGLLDPSQNEVEVMISHAWAGSTIETLSCMETLSSMYYIEKSARLFFCTMCIYQPDDGAESGLSIKKQLDLKPFAEVIKLPPKEGMFVVHTTISELYERLWCVHEVDECIDANIPIYGAFDPVSWNDQALIEKKTVETEHAICAKEDKIMLTALIKKRGGFARLDKEIIKTRNRSAKDLKMIHMFEQLFGHNHLNDVAKIEARDGLENYCHSLKMSLGSPEVKGKIQEDDKKKLEDVIEETIKSLNNDLSAEKEIFEEKQKSLEGICAPILAKVDARNGLENYCHSLKISLVSPEVKGKIQEDDKKKLEDAIEETIKLLNNDLNAEKEIFEEKQKSLEGICTPILAKVDARNGLENYCHSLKMSLGSPEVKGKIQEDDKKKLEDAIEETIKLLNNDLNAEKEIFEEKQKSLEGICTPILAKVDARNGLENYCHSLKISLVNPEIKDKIKEDDKKKLEDAIEKTTKWLHSDLRAEKEEFDEEKKSLNGIASPILHRGAGGKPDDVRAQWYAWIWRCGT